MRARREQVQRMSQAIRLLEKNLRTSIVAIHTNLSMTQLRDLYREIHGHSPVSGLTPESERAFATRQQVIEASILLVAYTVSAGNAAFRRINIEALIKGHDFYLDARRECVAWTHPPIDFTMAWVLARDLRSGLVHMQRCACGIQYATHQFQRLQPNCPICGHGSMAKPIRHADANA
ncbi:MAG TPA: FlhC family transcriptional regulator [Azospirillum sp.]|nr:FlhC family transcriptional regulator [Azospirillum sp.]